MDLPTFEELQAQVDELSEAALAELVVLYALKQIGDSKGLTLHQISGFHTPWVTAPTLQLRS